MSWNLIIYYGLYRYFDFSMDWANEGVEVPTAVQPQSRWSPGAQEYFLQKREEKRLREEARQNILSIAPERYDDSRAPGTLPGPYENVSIQEKIRLQNILGGSN